MADRHQRRLPRRVVEVFIEAHRNSAGRGFGKGPGPAEVFAQGETESARSVETPEEGARAQVFQLGDGRLSARLVVGMAERNSASNATARTGIDRLPARHPASLQRPAA